MASHNITGEQGEAAAILFLQEKGYTIRARNYRYRRAEIDIIAQKEDILVFAEVKTRSSAAFGFPEDFVSARKIALFLEAAEEYIYANNWLHDIRFDILAVTKTPAGFATHHIEDAFH